MGDLSLDFAVPVWVAIPVIIGSGFFAWWTYRHTLPLLPAWKRSTLFSLRTIGITLLLLCLFDLVVTGREILEDAPAVMSGMDVSESMELRGTDSSRLSEAVNVMSSLQQSELGSAMIATTFSDSVRPYFPDSDSFVPTRTVGMTDLGEFFERVGDSVRYRNLRAVVIATDGRYNAGRNPVAEAERLGLPVYVVGLGDSVEPRDLSIEQLFTNDVAYLGVAQPVQVRFRATGVEGGTSQLVIRDDRGEIASKPVTLFPGTNEYSTTVNWTPRGEGTARLTASLREVNGEMTTRNNGKTTLVKVRSNRRKIVMIAGAPSADYAFLRRRFSSSPEFTLETFVQRDASSYIGGALTGGVLNSAETLVLVDFPTSMTSRQTIDLINQSLARRGTPLLMVLGSNVDYSKLAQLEQYLPVSVGEARPVETEVSADLTSGGRSHPATRLGDSIGWSSLPPLFQSETRLSTKPDAEILATSRLAGTQLDQPLIVASQSGRARTLMVAGYGIWRWDLTVQGEAEARGRNLPDILNTFVYSTVRWLGVREQERRVRIRTSKDVYDQGEAVRFDAQVYDESYQPLNGAEVTLQLRGPRNATTVRLASSGSGQYQAIVTDLAVGDYSFSGTATVAGSTIGSDAGRFIIEETGIEFVRSSMNVGMLRSIAERTGGKFYTFEQRDQLVQDITENDRFQPRSIERRKERSARTSIIILLCAIGAFAFEWFMRKRNGLL